LQNRGEAYAKKGQYDKAEADLRDALKIRTQTLSPKNPIIATVKNNLANALIAEQRYPEAEELLKSALQIRLDALGRNHPSVARNLDALSKLYAANGNTASAVTYSREATTAVINHAATETLQVRQQQGALRPGRPVERASLRISGGRRSAHRSGAGRRDGERALGRAARA